MISRLKKSSLKKVSGALLLAGMAAGLLGAANNEPRWFRYYDGQRQPNVMDRVTPEHQKYGYDVLNASMQLISHVPPLPTGAELEKIKQDQEAQKTARAQQAKDRDLLRLYSGPLDATRAMNRQLEAINNRVEFLQTSRTRYVNERAGLTRKAADVERSGRKLPAELADQIKQLDKQIKDYDLQLQVQRTEIAKVHAEFDPQVQRLTEIEAARKARTSAAAPAAGTP